MGARAGHPPRARAAGWVHRPGGGWAFHYGDGETSLPDEVGYHFADERFLVGEYVSLNESGKMHTYRVTAVSYL